MGWIFKLFVALPFALVLIALGVANRQSVMFQLNPFWPEDPLWSWAMPFSLALFGALLLGVLLGAGVMWWQQRIHRRQAREQRWEAIKWHREADRQKEKADALLRQPLPDYTT
jgi:uncharacterized integral membrane protein